MAYISKTQRLNGENAAEIQNDKNGGPENLLPELNLMDKKATLNPKSLLIDGHTVDAVVPNMATLNMGTLPPDVLLVQLLAQFRYSPAGHNPPFPPFNPSSYHPTPQPISERQLQPSSMPDSPSLIATCHACNAHITDFSGSLYDLPTSCPHLPATPGLRTPRREGPAQDPKKETITPPAVRPTGGCTSSYGCKRWDRSRNIDGVDRPGAQEVALDGGREESSKGS